MSMTTTNAIGNIVTAFLIISWGDFMDSGRRSN
jgi:hypothetical protein